jgi:hypothetical protein
MADPYRISAPGLSVRILGYPVQRVSDACRSSPPKLGPLLCLSRISIQPRGLQRRPTWQTGGLSEWPRACYFVMARSQRNENQNEHQSRRGNDRLRPAAEIDSDDLVVVGAIHRGSLQSLRSITLGVILLTPARVVASGTLTEVMCDGQTIQ